MGKGRGKCGAASCDYTTQPPKPHRPTPRERTSAGAAVARTLAAMATPRKLAIEVDPSGGSREFVVAKALRGGEKVLSGPAKRFHALLLKEEEEGEQAHGPAGNNLDAAAAGLNNA